MFNEVIGQQRVKEKFIHSVKERRIPHAQLLHGQEGVGKLALAISYAQYICCTDRKEDDACGKCPSCVKFKALSHPDLHFVYPTVKTGSRTVVCDDFISEFRELFTQKKYFSVNDWYEKIGSGEKQGMIYVSESDEILRKLSLKTYESEYKVMIIWLPELMHESLSNKILKIVEEPPEATVFLLVSNRPELIINTILSRTQQIKVPPLSQEEIVQGLQQKHPNIEVEKLNIVAKMSSGSFLNAEKTLVEQKETNLYFHLFTELMRQAWLVGNKKDYEALKKLKAWADDIAKAGKERQKQFLSYAQKMIRENFIFNLKQENLNYMNEYEQDFSLKFSPFVNENNVEDLFYELDLAQRHIEQNTNPKMVFFDLALKTIMNIKKGK